MAVIEDIDMAIRVDGRDLREFFDQDSDHSEKSISKYIEAVSGAKFEIVTIVSRSHVFISDALGLEIFLDGELVQRPLITKADCNPTTNDYVSRHVRMIKGVSYIGGSGWEFRPFKFAEITFGKCQSADPTSSTDRNLKLKKSLPELMLGHASQT